MSKINIYGTGWLNMVFEGRNKAYGAYQLRMENPKTTIKAFFSAIFLLGGAAAIPAIVDAFRPEQTMAEKPEVFTDPITILEVTLPEKKTTPAAPTAPPISEKTTKFIDMRVTSKTNTTEEPATNNQLLNTQVGNTTVETPVTGPVTTVITTTPAVTTGTGGTAPELPSALEKQPEYPGGIAAFLSTVGKNFKSPAVDEEIKSLKVLVYFVIEKDGTLSNIKVTRDPGYNLGKEAARVLNSIKTKWEPGYKNGQPVRTAYNLPIVINVN